MNASATNSKGSQKQPATAVIPINKKEADSLIKKLDNALLKQGISPLAAFKKADVDGNGVILVTELKTAIQLFVPSEAIKPAEFKMLMMAFDVNRNGRIEQQEFIDAFVKARENTSVDIPKEPKEPAKVNFEDLNKQVVKKAEGREDCTNLLLKVILHRAGKS